MSRGHYHEPMPTIFTHAVAALGLGALFYRREVPKGLWALGAACAVLRARARVAPTRQPR